MKKFFAFTALVLLAATTGSAGDMQAGFSVGPTWAMSGDSFLVDPFSPSVPNSFKDDFDTGFTIAGYVAGPLSGMFGWRGEFGYDKMPADFDAASGRIHGDYKLYRVQGGVEICDFAGEGSGKPYAFFTLGLAKEDASLNLTVNNTDLQYDFDGESAFGLSFGGGYNHLIGETWGLGADIHINAGFFEDNTRWWWTPSAQVFFKF